MPIKIQTLKLSNKTTLKYVKKGFAVGKKLFAKEGYTQSINPSYMKKGKTIVHYNTVMKVWIVEKK